MRLDGAVTLVTGATSGIGAATARALAGAGARLLVTGRDEARLAVVAAETGGTPIVADLAAPDGPAVVAAAAAAAGGVDVLVSNAGVGWAGDFTRIPPERVTELVTVNLTAPVQLTRLLLPPMLARRRGRLLYVSSIAGATGVAGEAVYAAAKAGLAMFAESLAYETRGTGVGVCVAVPGVIDTPFFERRGQPYGRRWPEPLPAERVARAIVSALERDAGVVYVPGWLRGPVWVRGVAPRAFRALSGKYGGSAG